MADLSPEIAAGLGTIGAGAGVALGVGVRAALLWWARRAAVDATQVDRVLPLPPPPTAPRMSDPGVQPPNGDEVDMLRARLERLQQRHDELQDERHKELTALHRETMAALHENAAATRENNELLRAVVKKLP